MFERQLDLNEPALTQLFQKVIVLQPTEEVGQRLDHELFSDFYQNYVEKIRHYIQYRLGDPENAEDLTSLVFLKAWEKRDYFKRTGAPFIAWLYTIARNTIIDNHRGFKETTTLEDELNYESDGPSPSEACELHFERQSLRQALTRLTHEQYQVIQWKFFDGLTTEEIARRLGKKEGTVRALQMRALKKLYEEMLAIEKGPTVRKMQ